MKIKNTEKYTNHSGRKAPFASLISLFMTLSLLALAACSNGSEVAKFEGSDADSLKAGSILLEGSCSFGGAIPSQLKEALAATSDTDAGTSLSSEAAAGLHAPLSSSRSATSSFASDKGKFSLNAYKMESIRDEESGEDRWERSFTVYEGKVDAKNLSWSVELPEAGRWDIEILYTISFTEPGTTNTSTTYVLNGNQEISLDTFAFNKKIECDPIVLKSYSNKNIPGKISLEFYTDSESVKGISYSCVAAFVSGEATPSSGEEYMPAGSLEFSSEKDDSLGFESRKAIFEIPEIPAGVYQVSFAITDSKGKTLYPFVESFSVFSGFTTDTWYGSATYFMSLESEDGQINTKFVITGDFLSSSDILGQDLIADPLLLYSKSEDGIFYYLSSLTNPSNRLAFGTLAVSDFFIDDISHEIYCAERNVCGKIHKIKKYPYFGGYNDGRKIYEVPEITDPEKQSLDNFIISSVYARNEADAESKTVWLYLANTDTYDSEHQNFYIKRISGNLDDENSSIAVDDFVLYPKDSDEEQITRIEFNGSDGYEQDINICYNDNTPTFAYPKIAVYQDYLYLVYVGSKYSEMTEFEDDYGNPQERDFYFHDIYVRKFVITENENSYKLKEVASINTKVSDLAGVAVENFESASGDYIEPYHSPIVTDLMISSDGQTLYALLNARDWKNGIVNFGGLLTVTTTVTTGADGAENHTLEFGSGSLHGWHNQSSYPLSNEDQYFYGPYKFLAKKPDELYIADDGAYLIDDPENSEQKNHVFKKRLIKVNLETFALTAVDTDVTFATTAYDTPGCGYLTAY